MILGAVYNNESALFNNYIRTTEIENLQFSFLHGKNRVFFLTDKTSPNYCLFKDRNNLFLCNNIPIVRTDPPTGYETLQALTKDDLKEGFQYLIEKINSNTCCIFYDGEHLFFSSSRASAAKIYFRLINDGVIFSDDFRELFDKGMEKLNYCALYFIIKYGAAIPPLTISKDISVIPPAHYASYNISSRQISIKPYFQFNFSEEYDSDLSSIDTILDPMAKFFCEKNASILLSGGIDSSLLAHTINKFSKQRFNTYYLQFGKIDPEQTFAREVANKINCNLFVFDMDKTCEDMHNIVRLCVSDYTHPFNDFSTLPTYYLMKMIYEVQHRQIVIDGSGGDACFGFGALAQRTLRKYLFSTPNIFKSFISGIYCHSMIWAKDSLAENLFRLIVKHKERDINIAQIVSCPFNGVLIKNRQFDDELYEDFRVIIDSLFKNWGVERIFEEKATITDIIHICSNIFTAKNNYLRSMKELILVYPFLWKDVLLEQGKLSWSTKIKDNIVKYPLKKLLEDYEENSFIYRKKSGLIPPFEKWFKRKENYELLRETLLANNCYINALVDKSKLKQCLNRILSIDGWSYPLRQLLWGLLFTELWIKESENTL